MVDGEEVSDSLEYNGKNKRAFVLLLYGHHNQVFLTCKKMSRHDAENKSNLAN